MQPHLSAPQPTRIIPAPQPDGSAHGYAVLDVVLAEDEVVLWHWTHHPNGISSITGYTILKEEELPE